MGQGGAEDLVFQVPEERIRALGMKVIDGSLDHEVRDEGKVRNLHVRSLRLDFPTGVKMINAKLPDLRRLSCDQGRPTACSIFSPTNRDGGCRGRLDNAWLAVPTKLQASQLTGWVLASRGSKSPVCSIAL